MKKQPWPDEENAIVAAVYPQGWREVAKLLPHRSEDAIRKQASRLGVAPGSPPPFLQIERDEASAAVGLAMRAWRYPVERAQLRWAA
jgi:hypothetical protein